MGLGYRTTSNCLTLRFARQIVFVQSGFAVHCMHSDPQPDVEHSLDELIRWMTLVDASLDRQRRLLKSLTLRVAQLEVIYENFNLKIVAFPLGPAPPRSE